PQPTSVKTLQGFLGFANFYRKIIKNYLKTIFNLTSLLQKDTPFLLTEQALKEFNALKKAFTMAPILAHFIGGLISQYSSSNLLHPVKWRSYLLSLSEPFEVLTDHNALKYFMSSKVLTCQCRKVFHMLV
ncbi:uncharacterized protein VP01_12838g1, partial [Puccinia sorghi]